jgi:hypothetical protein
MTKMKRLISRFSSLTWGFGSSEMVSGFALRVFGFPLRESMASIYFARYL